MFYWISIIYLSFLIWFKNELTKKINNTSLITLNQKNNLNLSIHFICWTSLRWLYLLLVLNLDIYYYFFNIIWKKKKKNENKIVWREINLTLWLKQLELSVDTFSFSFMICCYSKIHGIISFVSELLICCLLTWISCIPFSI